MRFKALWPYSLLVGTLVFLHIPVAAAEEPAKDARLRVTVPRFQAIGPPPELGFLADAIPVLFRTALLRSESLVYDPEAIGTQSNKAGSAELTVEGRLLYFRGTLRLDALVRRKDTGKTASIHSSVVKSEQVYVAVEELATALQESLPGLAAESSLRRVAMACFASEGVEAEDQIGLLESELAFYLANRFSPRSDLALLPWRQVLDWCAEPPEELARKLRQEGADALVAGRIVVKDDKVSVLPEIRFLDPPAVVPLPPLAATTETFDRLEEVLLQDVQDAFKVLLEGGRWRLERAGTPEISPGARLEGALRILDSGQDLSGVLLWIGQAVRALPDDPNALTALGRVRLSRGQGDEALGAFTAAESLAGSSAELSSWIGEAHVKRNDLKAASQAYERAVAADRKQDFSLRLGEIYFLDAQPARALEQAQTALAQDPRSFRAHLLAGNIYRSEGRLDEAEKAFSAALENAPDNLVVRASLAEVLLRRTSEALEASDLDKALQLTQRSRQLVASAGNTALLLQILNQKERFSEAVEVFRQAEEAGLSSALVYSGGAAALFGSGQTEEALRLFDRALAMPGTEPSLRQTLLLNKGSLLVKALRYPQAAALLQDLESTCDPEWMVVNRFSAWTEMGRPDLGLASLNKALEKNPSNLRALESKGFILGRLGRYDESLGALERAIALDPSNLSAWTNKAWILGELGRYQEAVAAADMLLALSPFSANGFNHKGFSLFRLGQAEAGLSLVQKAVALNREYGGAHFNLARIYALQKRMKDARRELDLALDKDPWYREMALRDEVLRSATFRSLRPNSRK